MALIDTRRLVAACWYVTQTQVRAIARSNFESDWSWAHPAVARCRKPLMVNAWAIAFRKTQKLPWVSCFRSACALSRFLRHRGHAAQVRLGASRDKPRWAHAWVEIDNQVIGELRTPSDVFEPLDMSAKP